MEHRLLSEVGLTADQNLILSKPTEAVLSLITNSFTSGQTLSSLLEILILHIQNPKSDHQFIFSLLSALSSIHPNLHHRAASAAHTFIHLPSCPTPSIPYTLSLLDPSQSMQPDPFADEDLFLSLCFWRCVKTRSWVLRNMSKFHLRPSVFLTVLLGFTKDPYPYIRKAALDSLVILSNGLEMVEPSLVEGGYFRIVELLFDADNSVRCSAVRAVSALGQLLVSLNPEETKREWSDTLFVQLCLMIRDMDMAIRAVAFDALGIFQTVSRDILMQTLSKKCLPAIKDKSYPGQYTANVFKLPAIAAAFTFVHGLEDESSKVRKAACLALRRLTSLSTEFATGAVHILMDMLNDDSVVVRLQTLATLYNTTLHNHLNIEETHLHMLCSTLTDNNISIRSGVRKVLRCTKFQTLAMFRTCIEGFIENLELYPLDEADIINSVYKVGQKHGKFVTSIIEDVSQELEPSFDGKLVFNKMRTAALLVLAISAPVSFERNKSSIPPQLFSYAITFLDRLSNGLCDVMDLNGILAYLSCCSRFTFASASENLEGSVPDFPLEDTHVCTWKKSNEISVILPQSMELKKGTARPYCYLLDLHSKAANSAGFILHQVIYIWPLVKLGCIFEVVQTLRNWKEELRSFTCDSIQSPGVVAFALNYLHAVKWLAKASAFYFSPNSVHLKGAGALKDLSKTETKLEKMLHRFAGLNGAGYFHLLELMLVTCTLRLSYGGTYCFEDYMKKLNSLLRRAEHLSTEGTIDLPQFVIELQTASCEIDNREDVFIHKLHLLQNSLHLFSLKPLPLSGEPAYLNAKIDVGENNIQNPLPFVPGLPIGIPLDITLYNIPNESRLWLSVSLGGRRNQFIFLDLNEFGGCCEIRKSAFVAPLSWTYEVKHLQVQVSIAMECLSETPDMKCIGPKRKLVYLCKAKQIHLGHLDRFGHC